jgi:peptidoglycan hydrolase-like protein with peptidoglycan-binding domain
MSWIKKYENFREYRKIYESDVSATEFDLTGVCKLLRDAVRGPGTDPTKLRDVISKLNDRSNYDALNAEIKNRPKYFLVGGGANNLEEILKDELEGNNYYTAVEIQKKLKSIGVNMLVIYYIDVRTRQRMLMPSKIVIDGPETGTKENNKPCAYTPDQLKKFLALKKGTEPIFTTVEGTSENGKQFKFHSAWVWYSKDWYQVKFYEKWDNKQDCDLTFYNQTTNTSKSYYEGDLELVGDPGSHSDGSPTITLRIDQGSNFSKVLYPDNHIKGSLEKENPQDGNQSDTNPPPENSGSSENSNNSGSSKTSRCVMPKSKCIPLEKNLEIVKVIQKALSEVDGGKYKSLLGNFGPDGDGIDGHYGCSTLAAVKEFQKDNGIEPIDGIYGPITSKKLSEKLNRQVPPYCSSPETSTPTTTATPVDSSTQKPSETQTKTETPTNTQNKSQQEVKKEKVVDGAEIYARLLGEKKLKNRGIGRNTIVYKGEDLPEDEKKALIEYMNQLGFRISKDKYDARPGEKIIFNRN